LPALKELARARGIYRAALLWLAPASFAAQWEG
jgi:hypothetical protein